MSIIVGLIKRRAVADLRLPLENRTEAGRAVAEKLGAYASKDCIVLALPRGGLPVGYEVARALSATLDIILVRKLGAPGQTELAAGAIASGGIRVLNHEVIEMLGISKDTIDRITVEETRELQRRETLYRGSAERPDLHGQHAILVDDGVATGSTMRAAIAAVRTQQPARIIAAIPVGAADTIELLRQEADEVVCLATPSPFVAVGCWYRDFRPVSDDEVREYLAAGRAE